MRPRMRAGTLAIHAAALCCLVAASSCSMMGGDITAPRYALVYGVSAYPFAPDQLSYPSIDAADMKAVLAGSGYQVLSRMDLDASSTNIVADIQSLSGVPSNATVLVYFSGHGTLDSNGTTYFIPADGIDSSGAFVRSAWMDPARLSKALAVLPIKNIIVILDTCYSGGFVQAGSSSDSAPQNYGPNDGGVTPDVFSAAMGKFGVLLAANAGETGKAAPIVISAAGSRELSYETASLANGVFTHYLLESARNGDDNGDGYVTTTEAYAYSSKAIQSKWNAIYSDYYTSGSLNEPIFMDFLPHISGGVRDLVLFKR